MSMKCDVSVGIPVYNEEDSIEKVVLALLGEQSVKYVYVSDNCSTDDTYKILHKLSNKYNKLILLRQEHNVGSYLNAMSLIERIDTKYYIQLGGHDVITKGYIDGLRESFEYYDIVCAVGDVVDMQTRESICPMLVDNKELLYKDDWEQRYTAYLAYVGCNLPFYGVVITSLFRDAVHKYKEKRILGWDVLFDAFFLTEGKMRIDPRKVIYITNRHIGETQRESQERYETEGMVLDEVNPGRFFCDEIYLLAKNKNMSTDSLKKVSHLMRMSWGYGYNNKIEYHLWQKYREIKSTFSSFLVVKTPFLWRLIKRIAPHKRRV